VRRLRLDVEYEACWFNQQPGHCEELPFPSELAGDAWELFPPPTDVVARELHGPSAPYRSWYVAWTSAGVKAEFSVALSPAGGRQELLLSDGNDVTIDTISTLGFFAP